MRLEHPQRDGNAVIAPASRIAVVTYQLRNSEAFQEIDIHRPTRRKKYYTPDLSLI